MVIRGQPSYENFRDYLTRIQSKTNLKMFVAWPISSWLFRNFDIGNSVVCERNSITLQCVIENRYKLMRPKIEHNDLMCRCLSTLYMINRICPTTVHGSINGWQTRNRHFYGIKITVNHRSNTIQQSKLYQCGFSKIKSFHFQRKKIHSQNEWISNSHS